MKVCIRTPFAFATLFAVLAVGACSDDDDPADPGNEPPDEVTVQMDDNVFQPQEVKVAVGGTVTWDNVGGNSHTSTSDEDGAWDSGGIEPDETYERVFSTAGTFDYVCTFHNDMTGSVVVE